MAVVSMYLEVDVNVGCCVYWDLSLCVLLGVTLYCPMELCDDGHALYLVLTMWWALIPCGFRALEMWPGHLRN